MFQPKPGYHPKEAWFRSPDWDAAAKADFEAHLARARPSGRTQYRKIKAIALLYGERPEWKEVGYELLSQIAQDPDTDNFERVQVLSELGAYDQDHGRLADAERHLRLALAAMRANPSGSNGLESIRLAEVLLELGGEDRLIEARELVDAQAQDPSIFVKARFRLCVAAARVAIVSRRYPDAATWADAALKLAAATHSGLAKHPTLGLVDLDSHQQRWLTAVAARSESRDIRRPLSDDRR